MSELDVLPVNELNEKGEKHGVWEEYYENGMRKNQCRYVNGKKDGIYLEWYDTGEIMILGTYDEDQKMGYWGEYRKDKTKYMEMFFNYLTN